MDTKRTRRTRTMLAVNVAALALIAAPLAINPMTVGSINVISTAMAEESHSGDSGHDSSHGSDQGSMGHKGQGSAGGQDQAGHRGSKSLETNVFESTDEGEEGGTHEGEGGSGHEGGASHDHGQHDSNMMKGGGQGSPGEDSDAKGPRYSGGRGEESHGGKPQWAQEGIPEVELGRLNVARSPSHVLERSLAEALATLEASPDLYTLPTLEAVIAAIKSGTLPGGTEIVRIDSPLENLALYKDLLTDGKIVFTAADGTQTVFTTSLSTTDLAAIFLGGASDKTVDISADTVTAVGTILGVSLPEGTDLDKFVDDADAVREAILEAHGE